MVEQHGEAGWGGFRTPLARLSTVTASGVGGQPPAWGMRSTGVSCEGESHWRAAGDPTGRQLSNKALCR